MSDRRQLRMTVVNPHPTVIVGVKVATVMAAWVAHSPIFSSAESSHRLQRRMELDQDKWGLVPPLLECLPMMTVTLCDEADSNPHVSLYTGGVLPDETPHDRLMLWRRRVEALELLTVIYLIDPDVWIRLLSDRSMGSISGHKSKGESTPVYCVFLSGEESNEFIQSSLNALFTSVPDEERSEEFHAAKSKILKLMESEIELPGSERLRPLVRIVPTRHTNDQRSMIQQYLEVICDSSSRCKLVSLGFFNPNRVSLEDIGSIHDQIQRGLPLGTTLMGLIDAEAFLTPHTANHLFTDLIGEYGATSLDIRHLNRRREILEAFFSKLTDETDDLRHSSLRALKLASLHIGGSLAQRRSALLWWFYCLFSEDARHSIQHLQHSVDRSRTTGDFLWLSELLRTHGAPRPELFIADVFDEYVAKDGSSSDQWVVVPRGYPIRVEHGDGWRDTTLVFEDRTVRLRILRDDPTWSFVDVLVPGYGRCWVERSETLAFETRPQTKWTFDNHSIRSMDLGLYRVNEVEKNNVCELLALVGRPVQKLHLTRWTSQEEITPIGVDVDFLARLVRSCPQLQELCLASVPVANADVLVDLFEHNACPITTLDLSYGAFADRMSVVLFLEALGDPTLKISRTLEVLYLDLTGYASEGENDDETLVLAVFGMLQANRFLRSVDIHMPREHFATFGSQFRALRETPVAIQKAPLALRAKRAMLSVISQKTKPLEQEVITSLFRFAAECELREITVTAPSPRRF